MHLTIFTLQLQVEFNQKLSQQQCILNTVINNKLANMPNTKHAQIITITIKKTVKDPAEMCYSSV